MVAKLTTKATQKIYGVGWASCPEGTRYHGQEELSFSHI